MHPLVRASADQFWADPRPGGCQSKATEKHLEVAAAERSARPTVGTRTDTFARGSSIARSWCGWGVWGSSHRSLCATASSSGSGAASARFERGCTVRVRSRELVELVVYPKGAAAGSCSGAPRKPGWQPPRSGVALRSCTIHVDRGVKKRTPRKKTESREPAAAAPGLLVGGSSFAAPTATRSILL